MEYDYQGVTCPNFETLYVEAYKNEPWKQRIESSALLDIARSSLVAPFRWNSSSRTSVRVRDGQGLFKCPRGPVSTFAENLITDWTRTEREKNACLHKNSVEYFHSLSNSSPRQCQRYSAYPSTLLFKFLKGSNFKDPPQAWPSPCSADAASGVGNRAPGPGPCSVPLQSSGLFGQLVAKIPGDGHAAAGTDWRMARVRLAAPHRPGYLPSPPMPLAYFLSVSVTAWSGP